MRSYRDILWYMYSFTDYERRGLAAYAPEFYDLDRVRHLLSLLGDPHETFQSVHIAGTKGKGSTAAMVESVLRAAGHRTGLYTSPHLHTFRERIQASGELISETDVVRLIEEMRALVAQVPGITTFEVMTGLAFAWFAEQNIEWAVVEVGLGGRLDATNVLTPAVAVITSISHDHTGILGDTLAKIAAEKAGIVKPGTPVVCAPQDHEALAVIEETCRQQGAPLTLVSREWTWELIQTDLEGQVFNIRGERRALDGLSIPLLGRHQLVNAATAVAVLTVLGGAGMNLDELALREGLRSVHWPGRLEILGRAPLVVADGAHNGDSAQKLMAALRELDSHERTIVVLGGSVDHLTTELLTALLSGADRGIATQARHPRAVHPAWIQERAAELGYTLEVSATVPQALRMALQDAGPADLICCTGSLFVAAEARAAWFARQGMEAPPTDPP